MLELTEIVAMPRTTPKRDRLVLLVEPDAVERDQFGSWLEAAGRRLVHYYLSSGKPVMLLGDPAQLGKRYRDDQVVVLPQGRNVSRRTFIKTVQRLEAMA
jgi:hypothetical protein